MPELDPRNLQLILLDRDGVINYDSPDYIKSADEWQPIPGALEAIVAMQKQFRVAVCTNQSGLGRGLFDTATLAGIHAKLQQHLSAAGGTPIDIFFCPHHPDDGCSCRKPASGLLDAAMQAYAIDATTTVFAGDSTRDLEAAKRAGCHPVLLLTGNGRKALESLKTNPPAESLTSHRTPPSTGVQQPLVFDDLAAMAKHLLGR